MTRQKSSAGTVVIESVDGRLRLRWQAAGKRYAKRLGLPDTPINRKAAEAKAKVIESDIAYERFDPTLEKYFLSSHERGAENGPTVALVFEQFMQHKAGILDPRTLIKYRGCLQLLKLHFASKPAKFIGQEAVEQFTNWIKTTRFIINQQGYSIATKDEGRILAPLTARERLVLIRAAWNWAAEPPRRWVEREHNPWQDMPERVKVAPKRPKPFTRTEMQRIIEAFSADRYYSHYTDFVRLLFGTGMRTGEAIGLRWGSVSEDCSVMWIGEALSKGVRKATKTNRARYITLPVSLQVMIADRRRRAQEQGKAENDDLIFLGQRGSAYTDKDFRNRAWKTILERLDIMYRKPYTTRSSLVSHALDMGMAPAAVAELTGHDVQVMYRHYSGNVSSRPRLPEL